MALQRFIQQESNILTSRIVFMLIFSGLATGLLVFVINHASDAALSMTVEGRMLFLYISVFLLYVYTQKYALAHTIYPFDDALYKLRLRLIKKVTACDLAILEKMSTAEPQEYLSKELNLSAQLLPWVTYSAQAAAVLLFCLIYLAWLSTSAFLTVAVILAVAALWHLFVEKDILQEFKKIREAEHEFSLNVGYLSTQAIALRSNQVKRKNLLRVLTEISQKSEQLKLTIDRQTISSIMSTRIALFLLLAIFVFIIPLYDKTHLDLIFKITIITFFIMGPVSQLVYALPLLLRLNVALESLYAFETHLNTVSKENTAQEQFDKNFHALRFSSAGLAYSEAYEESNFLFEELNLTIDQGEIIFLQGDSGSGKTSLLKLMAGLYAPNFGSVYIDKKRLKREDYPLYRELFFCVFHETHLIPTSFDKFSASPERVNNLLEQTFLQDKVEYRYGNFYYHHLSLTQQQRLGLVFALLSDKPILMIDDCCLGQNTEFLKVFYEEILEELRSEGKTVILVNLHKDFEALADKVWVIHAGEVQVSAPL